MFSGNRRNFATLRRLLQVQPSEVNFQYLLQHLQGWDKEQQEMAIDYPR